MQSPFNFSFRISFFHGTKSWGQDIQSDEPHACMCVCIIFIQVQMAGGKNPKVYASEALGWLAIYKNRKVKNIFRKLFTSPMSKNCKFLKSQGLSQKKHPKITAKQVHRSVLTNLLLDIHYRRIRQYASQTRLTLQLPSKTIT